MINIFWNIDLAEYENIQKEVSYSVNTYPEIIDVIGDLIIEINNGIYFKEPYFPILEIIRTLEKWDKVSNMLYNCIETDNNPLISFIFTNVGWLVKSPWELFKCKELFSKEELLTAISDLILSVKMQLKTPI